MECPQICHGGMHSLWCSDTVTSLSIGGGKIRSSLVELFFKGGSWNNEETGELRKRTPQVFKGTSILEFLIYFKPNLQKFIKHSFLASWQDK